MKLGTALAAFILAALPSAAGTLFTIDPTLATPTNIGTYAGGAVLIIGVTGVVNLNGPSGAINTNPDGSLNSPAPASCTACWAPGYQYFLAGATSYPTVAGGDGINHFAGGGGNFDLFPGGHAAFAPEGAPTTNTADPGAIRFGALAGTWSSNPNPTDWFLLGSGGTFVVPGGGGTLRAIVVDTFYPNNTGGFSVTIDQAAVPEPAAVWLAFSGIALLGLPRAYRRLRKR